MKPISDEILFLSARRTPFGTFGGSLKDQSATDLGVHSARAAIAQAGVPKEDFDHVVFGNVAQTSPDAIYLARHVGLLAGLPARVPALTVNRLCGSGFEAIIQAATLMLTHQAHLVLAGGTESMSQAPHVIRGARWGIPLGKGALEDTLWSSLTDSFNGLPMGVTAENLAERYGISQEEVDEYSVLTQRRFAAAKESGRLNAEIAPVEMPGRKGQPLLFSRDEHNRPDTTLESFAKLPRVFKKEGVIHPGAASGISDGAGALVLSTRTYAARRGLSPIGRLLGWAHAGCDPDVMGIGPVPAIRNLMERHQFTLEEVDLVEVNEAFAPQFLAVEKELRLDRNKTNVNGGAIAVGHPLAASGARITMHLLYELKARGKRFGVGSACIGGGQGIAVLVEAL
ncbi:MAG: acetyl-CoA C-acetyltransferase [Deltaproteobacteria bacterium]|nr:acetyl-CoA C-acetyltransferase [Deltaproteobacteria bacterium]